MSPMRAEEKNRPPVSRRAAVEAAEWFVTLSDSGTSAHERHGFEAWLARSEEHRLAWERATQISAKAAGLPSAIAVPVLTRRQSAVSKRAAVQALAVLIVGVPTGWMAWQSGSLQHRLATFATATGERRQWTLADGGRVTLDTGSAVDVEYGPAIRLLRLHAGAIYIETAADTDAANRPFVVQTDHGRVRAIGTRFTVRQDARRSRVAVTQGAVEVSLADGSDSRRIEAGNEVSFNASALMPTATAAAGSVQWARGILAVENMRLDEFAAELARYRPGIVRCDPAVAHLRITGAFQLNDTEAVLLNVIHLLPVDVVYRTRYWATLVPRAQST